MKKFSAGLLTAIVLGLVAIPSADAQVRPSPTPILTIAPTFNCGVTITGTSGTVTVTKANAAAVDKTHDVVAIVQTPSGKVSAALCGAQFTSAAVGTKATGSFTAPPTTDKSYIYTCTASQTQTTFACNPPK
jgi:hypothetical protein